MVDADDSQFDGFPSPVPPPDHVHDARRQRLVDVTRIAVLGVLVRIVVIAAELVGVALSGSSVLLVDAISSLYDVVSSIVLVAAMRFAARPPDEHHPFGHGRAEPLAGFQLGVLLCGTGAWLVLRNVLTLVSRTDAHRLPVWLAAIPAGATLLLFIIMSLIHRAGCQARSTALLAEAKHFQIDAWTSLLTAVTLLVAAWLPEWSGWLDHLGGTLLALLMVALGALAVRENLHQLLDRAPREDDLQRVRASALAVDGVIDVEKTRIQHAGPDAHVDIDIEVDPRTSVAESHQIAQHVRASIQSDWPFVREVVVHVEPYYAGDH